MVEILEKFQKIFLSQFNLQDCFKNIWNDERYSYASNGFLIIRIPVSDYGVRVNNVRVREFDFEIGDLYPVNVDLHFNRFEYEPCPVCDADEPFPTCKFCEGKTFVVCELCETKHVCISCNGTGSGIERYRCYSCFGEGIDPVCVVEVENDFFSLAVLSYLFKTLENVLFYKRNDDVLLFSFGRHNEGRGLLKSIDINVKTLIWKEEDLI